MSKRRPNILHLFTDQQRFDTIAALGNSCIRTPNLDRLVYEGTVFQRAYTPSPECVPARASMITGWYPSRTECYCNEQSMPVENTPTYMQALSEAGYETIGIGKCHFTPDAHSLRGFQRRVSQEEIIEDRSRDDYASWLIEKGFGDVLEPHGVRGEMYYIPQISVLPEALHPTKWIGDRIIDFIDDHDTDQPWYCYAGFIHPHPPFAPPIPWHKEYRAPEMPLPDIPENVEDLLSFVNLYQNRYKYRDRGLDLNLVRCLKAYYYSCIAFIDHQVGCILESLEHSGQLENTLIVFSSDHGEYLGDYGSFGKRGMHEVSSRVPMLVRWPGAEHAGTSCEHVVSLVDLAPTFLEAADISFKAEDFDGLSLRAVLEQRVARDWVFSQYNRAENGLYMMVGERWKYIYSAPDQREYLFDIKNDPHEHRNLADQSSTCETLNCLRGECIRHLVLQGERTALEHRKWRKYPRRRMPQDPDVGLIYQDPPWWSGARRSPNR